MIHRKLRTIRKAKGISQEKMAELLCTVTSNYSRKERGEVRIQDDEWGKIANALEVTIEDIKENIETYSLKNEDAIFNDQLANQDHNFSESVIKNLQDFIKYLQTENERLTEKLKKYEDKN